MNSNWMKANLLISLILLNGIIIFADSSYPILNDTIPDAIDNDTIILRGPPPYKSHRIRYSINESVNPCENFYKFVCGDPFGHYIVEDNAEWRSQKYEQIKQMIYRKGIKAYYNLSDAYVHMLAVCDTYKKTDLFEFSRQKFSKLDKFLKTNPRPNIPNLMLQVLPQHLFYIVRSTLICELPMIKIEIRYELHPYDRYSGVYDFREPIRISKDVVDKFRKAGIVSPEKDAVLTTVGVFQNMTPSANWTQYLTAFLPPKILQNLADRNMTIDEMQIATDSPAIVMRYEAAIARLTQEEIHGYSKTCLLTDVTKRSCRAVTNQTFQLLFNRILYEQFKLNKLPVLEIADGIRLELWNEIYNSGWLTAAGKRAALKKLEAMRLELGAPKSLLNDTLFFDFYSTLNISKIMAIDNAAEMTKMVEHWMSQRQQEIIVTSEHWRIGLLDEDEFAYYIPSLNRLFIGFGHFRELLYLPNGPPAFNYGILGSSFGHEMGHGFALLGQHISSCQPFEDRWNTTAFRERVNCFTEQYRSYMIDGSHISTEDANMEENIADHIGIRSAYGAFEKFLAAHPIAANHTVEGLEKYTDRQLFFISTAYFYCENNASDSSPHSPPEARVNVMLSQLDEFADAFDCDIGTRMNPGVKDTYRYYSRSKIVFLLENKYDCADKKFMDFYIRTVIKNGTTLLFPHLARELYCKLKVYDKCSIW